MQSKELSALRRGVAVRLFLIWLTIFSAYAVLLFAGTVQGLALPWAQLAPFGVFSLFVLVSWLVLCNFAVSAETRIIEIVTFLSGIGIVMQFRMGTFANLGIGNLAAPPLGFALMLAVFVGFSRGRWKVLSSLGFVCYGVALLSLAAMLVFGRRYRGGLYLPGNINPTEIVKPLLVIFLASFLSGKKKDFSETVIGVPMPPRKTLVLFSLLWVAPVSLVVLSQDLGLLLLLNATLVVMLYAIGRKLGYLIIGLLGVVASGGLVWLVSAHARARIDVWMNPFADPTGSGWQILQGLSAIYAGGIWGAGIGAGTPHAVPIVTSDFVYAAIAEELGIIICAVILFLFGVIFVRGLRIASENRTPFGILLAVGLTSSLAFQTLINLAGVTKAMPMTGIVLPYISQGGSSLVTMLAMAGLLAALSDRK